MIPMQNFFISFSFFLATITSIAQTTGIGQWRDHLPYSQCIGVKEVGTRIYCATPYSIFYYDKEDNSIQRINKINGLSDIGISAMNYSNSYKTLVIAYTNANIDLIKNNTIINISDIKRASILGNKTINNIFFIGQYAYLCCGFGIVVLDVDKEEIHDTYYIGANGGQVNVFGLTKNDGDTLFAATEHGVYYANANNSNLANYQSWTIDTRLNTSSKYDNIINFSGQVIVSRIITLPAGDSLYRYYHGKWTKWVLGLSNTVEHLESDYGKLIITYNSLIKCFDTDFNLTTSVLNYNGGGLNTADAILDNAGLIWIADNSSGLAYITSDGSAHFIHISGPLSSLVFDITTFGNDVYIVPGGRDLSYVPNYNPPAVYHYNNTSWNNLTSSSDVLMQQLADLSTISVDPSRSESVV